MRRTRRIAVSTAVTTGLLGLGGVAVAAVPAIVSAAETPTASPSQQATAQRLAIQQALAAMEQRTKQLGGDLSAAHSQLTAAQKAAAARAAAAAAAASTTWSGGSSATPSSRPTHTTRTHATPSAKPSPTHTTTGASGSTGGDDGGSGGGDD
jgi:hypothetical protein